MVRGRLPPPSSRLDASEPERRGRTARRVKLPIAPATEPLPAGDFAEWLRVTRDAREQQRAVDVPCGECTACCRSSLFILIAPDERDTLAHIAPELLFPAPGAAPGHVVMGFDRQGRCPMLSAAGCSIYEHRPRTCRNFDCRAVAATGVLLDEAQHAIGEQARRWRFAHPLPEDERQHAAVRAAAAFLSERGPELLPDSLPSHPLQLAMLATRVYEVFYAPAEAPGEARLSDTELASAILSAITRHSRARGTDRATSVKRAPLTRS